MKWSEILGAKNAKPVESVFDELERQVRDLAQQYNGGGGTDDALRLCIDSSRGTKSKAQRLLIFNGCYALSFRADGDVIKGFLLRTSELARLAQMESTINLRMLLQVEMRGGQPTLLLDSEIEVEQEQLKVLLLSLVEDLIRKSMQMISATGNLPRMAVDGRSISTAVRQLVHDKHKLLNDLLSQNEVIQTGIAREIHDDVISDLLFLKKKLLEGQTADAAVSLIDDTVRKLRDICSGLSARDLQDWGLLATINDMLQKLRTKTGMDPQFERTVEVPDFPPEVQLQIYRIVQEALNNSLKHSGGDQFKVSIAGDADAVCFSVQDNGKGLEQHPAESEHSAHSNQRGTGLRIMHERASIIDAMYSAALTIVPLKPNGTSVSLKILTAPRSKQFE